MPRILAVDWDPSEARCVLAATAGTTVRVLWTTTVSLLEAPETEAVPAHEVGNVLQAALAAQRLGRVTTLVGLDRASVELFSFTLPPATDAELPLLVQNQVLRESTHLHEDDAVDFVAATANAAEPRPVTVGVLSAARRQAIRQACQAAGVKPDRIVLRPLAATACFLHAAAPPEPCSLLVNVLGEEVDLTVVQAGRPMLLRTVRLPVGVGEDIVVQRLIAEINRTLVVVQQRPLGIPPERIYLFGGPGEHQLLADRLLADSALPLTVLDPFTAFDTTGVDVPGNAGRFASLLGMAIDEAHGTHTVDFLHPKGPPRPGHRRRALVIGAAILGLFAAVVGYLYWDTLANLRLANQRLSQQRKELDDALKRSRGRTQLYQAVRDWKAGEIVWLDELRELSLRLPPSRDLLVHRLSLAAGRSGGGVIELQGVARTAAVIAQIDRAWHNEFHSITSRRVGDYPQGRDYSWLFERTILATPREKQRYREP